MDTPEPGFYYHYKHDGSSVNNYAYEVMSVGTHTETHEEFVIYRTLYESEGRGGARYWLRPQAMFVENITKDGKTFPRFAKITDPEIISQLTAVRDRMYPAPR